MGKERMRKLKVFQAPFGFFDSVVAAPSQAAALRAWGSHQNLFAEGFAFITTDETAIAAALQHPEMPLRRAIGSDDPFELNPRSLPKIPDTKRAGSEAANDVEKKSPKPDRSMLDRAEATLQKLEERHKAEIADIASRRSSLDDEEASLERSYNQNKSAAREKLKTAAEDYKNAGG